MVAESVDDLAEIEKTTSSTLTAVFEKKQETYRIVTEKNHLRHHDIVREVKRYLSRKLDQKTVSVLDLGCGDCSISAACFQKNAIVPHDDPLPIVSRFVGVDLARKPLEVASKSNLFSADTEAIFHEAEFFEYMDSSSNETFDIIIAFFAIHHLETGRKLDLLQKIKSRLNPGGIFIWGDVVNNVAGRSREDMMKDWEPFFLETGFNGLNEEQRHEIWGHASTYDLPEDFPTMNKLFHDSQFKDVQCLYKDDFYVAVWVAQG